MNKNGSGGSQIAAAMAILFFNGFCAGVKTSPPPQSPEAA
jgi:hypothetical protein